MIMSENVALTAVKSALSMSDYKEELNALSEFVKQGMHKDFDYGEIPYTKGMSLLQPGAEKLAKKFGLVPKYECLKEVEDYEKSFIYKKYKCILIHYQTGNFVGEAIRSSNSKEKSFKGKDIYELANPVEAKAQKRALVAAVRLATMASEIFYDGGDSEEDETPPGKSVTQVEDPERHRLMGALFQAGCDRGFEEVVLKQLIYKKMKVESLKDVSNKQLSELIEDLITTFRLVGRGNKWEKFDSISSTSEKPHVEETKQQVVGQGGFMEVEYVSPPPMQIMEGEVFEMQTCRNKKRHGENPFPVKPGSPSPYFCSQECWDEFYPAKPSTESLQEKIQRNKELAAQRKAAQ